MKARETIKDIIITLTVLALSFAVTVLMQLNLNVPTLAPMVFVMAVFLISILTKGYVYGIAASLIGVLAVNFAFTFPYFAFNFTIPENLLSGVVMLFVAVTTSTLITNLKKQERMRAENEKEKVRANLLRAVSHDLRTPLTSIYGSCSTIMENYDSLDKEKQLKLLGEVCADTEWLNRMVENLLSVTRIESGGVSLVKTPTVFEELLDSVLIKFKKHHPGQQVELDIPDSFIVIPMDSILIEQVIINLLENAVYHAKGMTKLVLRVSLSDGFAVFEVTDDGCGIEKEKAQMLLSGDYIKNNNAVDSGRQSMGIGLSVCSTIIKAHSGDIEILGSPGKGTTIRFSLKAEEADNE